LRGHAAAAAQRTEQDRAFDRWAGGRGAPIARGWFHEEQTKMALFSEGISSMDDLFMHTLEDIYYAEHQIEKALPEMAGKATEAELKRGFEKHLEETRNQIKRLDDVFQKLGQEPKGTDCPAIDGIIEESNEIVGEIEDKRVIDAALIAAAQAVEHYEITRYGTLIAWAQELGHRGVVSLLQRNLKEEAATDKKLTTMATRRANPKAVGGKKASSGRKSTARGRKAPAHKSSGRGSSARKSTSRGRRKAA
jgi:ferritin-like metal-binding protein YciE